MQKPYITKVRLLQSTLDNAGGCLRVARDKLATNDRGADQFRSVNNLFYPRHAERDVHGSYARKVECLQSHLGSRLAD
jgi:hypothetical protein